VGDAAHAQKPGQSNAGGGHGPARPEGIAVRQPPRRTFAGNRPTNTILAPKLTSRVLGQLIALAEHKVFTQGTIWHINSFDRCAVEAGEALATRIAGELDGWSPRNPAGPRQLDQRPDPLLPPSPNAGVATRSCGSGRSSARGRLGFLGPVHSLVGLGDQIGGLRGRAIGDSHADAEADGHLTIVDDHGLAERSAQTTYN
jgi:Phosphoglucose isomerase